MTSLRNILLAGVAVLAAGAAHAQALSNAVAVPLQAAEQALSGHRFSAALHDVAQAEAVPGKTAAETLTIAQVRAAIDAARGAPAAAAADYAALLATGDVPPAQATPMAEAEASSYYQAGDYADAAAAIKANLMDDPRYQQLLVQSYFKMNDCPALAQAVGPHAAKASLQMVAYCYASKQDNAGYVKALEALVRSYPSPTYWTQLLGQLGANPDYSDRLALDFFRLQLAAGVTLTEPAYMEAAQEALQAGLNNEAQAIVTQGFASGVMGTGADLDRQNRLKALIATRVAAQGAAQAAAISQAQAAHDEQTLFNVGWNQVEGGDAGGLAMMEDAIRSGGITQVAQAELEMGIAYKEAGQAQKAKAMWRAVHDDDGAQTLAGLWPEVK